MRSDPREVSHWPARRRDGTIRRAALREGDWLWIVLLTAAMAAAVLA